MTLSVAIQSKHFANGTCAIRNLNFAARPGEFLAIVGPSGAGKTTLLKIISGLDTAFEGQLQLPSSGKVGYMFQEPRLMPWLTVAQNLRLGRLSGAQAARPSAHYDKDDDHDECDHTDSHKHICQH